MLTKCCCFGHLHLSVWCLWVEVAVSSWSPILESTTLKENSSNVAQKSTWTPGKTNQNLMVKGHCDLCQKNVLAVVQCHSSGTAAQLVHRGIKPTRL